MGKKISPQPMGGKRIIISTRTEPTILKIEEEKNIPDIRNLNTGKKRVVKRDNQRHHNNELKNYSSGKSGNGNGGSGNKIRKKKKRNQAGRMIAAGGMCFLVAATLFFGASMVKKSSLLRSREIINEATEMAENGDYEGALKTLDSAEETFFTRSAINSLRNDIKSAYRQQILEASDYAAEEGNYQSAANILDEGIEELQGDTTLEEEKAKYLPVDLTELEPSYQGYVERIAEEITDTNGDVYYTGLRGFMDADDPNAYVIWTLNGEYKYLSARGIVRQEDRESDYTGAIKIYGDGNLLFERTNIGGETLPYDINVDIENVRELKIEMTGNGNMGNYGINSVLVNVFLHKW